MSPEVLSLVDLTRAAVTAEHVADYAPNDPGYWEYVHCWTALLRPGAVPAERSFELSETIGLTGWDDPASYEQPERFRQFRRFTSAVATALIVQGECPSVVRAANYVLRDLLVDLGDAAHAAAVRTVLPVLREALIA